jgi:MFS family permease
VPSRAAAGRWLSLFYTAIPVGTAMGYPFGSLFARSSLGWGGAFFVEALVMLPIAIGAFFLPFNWRPERPVHAEADADFEESSTQRLLSSGAYTYTWKPASLFNPA